jgi:Domain of unknown function (DUF1929)
MPQKYQVPAHFVAPQCPAEVADAAVGRVNVVPKPRSNAVRLTAFGVIAALGSTVAWSAMSASLSGCTTTVDGLTQAQDDEISTGKGVWSAQIGLRDNTSVDQNNTPRPTGGWYVTPIHTTLLPTGKVFVTGWSRVAKDTCQFPGGSRRNGVSFLFDPAVFDSATKELTIAPLAENATSLPGWKTVLYCAGHSPVIVGGESGVLITGGARYLDLGLKGRELEEGTRSSYLGFPNRITSISSPNSPDGWTKSGPICKKQEGQEKIPGESLARGGKWYATNTRMPDGNVLITGGFTGGPGSTCVALNDRHSYSAEVFETATKKYTALVQPEDFPNRDIGESFAPGDKDYTHTVLLPQPISRNGVNYQVAMMGYAGVVVLMNTDRGTPVDKRFLIPNNARRPGGVASWDSTLALTSTRELMVMGGTDNLGAAGKIHLFNPYAASGGSWREIDTRVGRRNASTILLPDGKVLIVNGSRELGDGLGDGSRAAPMVFDPEAAPGKELVTLAADPGNQDRGYHSFALLGKDASVMMGGGVYPIAPVNGVKQSDIGCERTDVQRYRLPYITSASPRPVITTADTTPIAMKVAGPAVKVAFSGAALDARKGAVLMALGSFTHGFDQNQRYVRLAFTAAAGSATLQAPANATLAPPGDYILYLISDKGVPSVGKHVRVSL